MKLPFLTYPIVAAFAFSILSCTDDPALVEKRDRQKAEIARLKGEFALIEEKLKKLPPDVSQELANAKQLNEKQSTELAGLESEITSLEARKRALTAEFEAYKIKYSIK